MGTMATRRRRRMLFLCVGLLLCDVLAFSGNPVQSKSWFDQRFAKKTQALIARIHGSFERDALSSVALLDELYDLRDHVSDPFQIDSTLSRIVDDPSAIPIARAEATYLSARIKGSFAETPEGLSAILARGTATMSDDDADIREAISAIALLHHLESSALSECNPEAMKSADSAYLAARLSRDDYHALRALRRTLELNRDYLPAVAELAKRYSAQGQITRARNLLSATLERYPADTSLRVLLIDLDINQGRVSAALEIMNQLRSKPLSIAVMRELAENYAQIRLLDEARELAHLALRLHPGGSEERDLATRLDEQADADLTTKHLPHSSPTVVARLSGETPNESSDSRGEAALKRVLNGESAPPGDSREFFVDVFELIKKWRSQSQAEKAESRVLADVRVDLLRADYQTVQHVQQLIAVGSSGDIATYKQRGIQYSGQSQQLNILHARLHHSGGRVSEGEDLGESSLSDSSLATYDDLRSRQYRFRDLRVGDVIELEYTISPLLNENPYGKYFAQLVAFGTSVPTDFQRYVLRSPRDIHLSSSERGLSPATLQRRSTEDVHIWEKSNMTALVREPRSPSWSEQGAYLHVSNFDSWETLGKWYADLIRPQFKLNAELEQQVAKIVQNHPNRLDRVAAIDDLVLKNTRYVALELGVYGFKPYPVTQTFARRFGDCKDKASLMVALLRAADIDADIALVRTKRLGDIIGQPASVSIFDHAIVYVPEFGLWLDGTAEFSSLRELPVDDQEVMALTVGLDGEAKLRRTPGTSADDNYSRRTINARLAPDGTIQFTGATYVRGEDAPELRRQLEPGESKLGYVRDHLAQVLPAVEVHDVQLPVNLSDTVSLSFSGELTSFHGRHSATLPSSWMERNYSSTLATRNSRTQDLLLEAPWTTTEEIHVELPEGAHLTGVPQSQTISSEFGSAEIRYDAVGDHITVLSKVKFSATRIPAAQYAAFREFAAGVEMAFRRNLEVELP